MKLVVDMNLSPRWVRPLTDTGPEAVNGSSIGEVNATDFEITAFAREHGYVVLTHDLDFSAILAAAQGEKPSVVQIGSENVSPDAIGHAVLDGRKQMADEIEKGALLTVDPKRTVLRLLPQQTRGDT